MAARHILGKPSDGIKPTFVWSSFGGLHLRSAGSYLNQYSDVKYLSTGDKHVCLYYNKDTGLRFKYNRLDCNSCVRIRTHQSLSLIHI